MYFELTDHFVVSADLQQTWGFFSSAENLPAITPPWLGFRLLPREEKEIQKDSILNYTIKWMGIPIRWRTRIIDWTPPRQFIDLQIRGPYTLWHHQHTFEESADGTVCRDRVIYKVPVPVIGTVINAMLVRRQLVEIFEFRRKVIAERLGWVRAMQEGVEVRGL